jgi:hypothetical protein
MLASGERLTGVEPAQSCLGSTCSATELQPHVDGHRDADQAPSPHGAAMQSPPLRPVLPIPGAITLLQAWGCGHRRMPGFESLTGFEPAALTLAR